MKFKTAYGKSSRVTVTNNLPSLTRQEFAKESDINNILKQYNKTGMLSHLTKHRGDYTELSQIDYHTALNQLNDAKESFDSLPSELRKKFEFNPANFIAFVSDPENKDEIAKMGLLKTPDIHNVIINNLDDLVSNVSPSTEDHPTAEG